MASFSKQYKVFYRKSVLILALLKRSCPRVLFFFILREINCTDFPACHMPESVHNAFRGLSHLILATALED